MRSIILTCLIVVATSAYAQCPAPESFVKGKSKTKDAYTPSSQSRSGSVKSGETYEISFIAQAGMDYRLSSKAYNPSAGTIAYEVYELVVEKKTVDGKETFKRVKHVLANSGQAGGAALEFSTDQTRKVFIEVSLTGGDAKKAECVGVLIETKKATKLGF